MLVSELMEYPKIKALMKKYWNNDEASGIWGGEGMTQGVAEAFIWEPTEEGHEFWSELDIYSLEYCKNKYPEYFTKEEEEETPSMCVDTTPLKEWPKLHARAEHILSYLGEVHSFEEAVKLYYEEGLHHVRNQWEWEGVRFWELIDQSNFEKARKWHPSLFEKGESYVPKLSPNEPTIGAKPLDVLGLKPKSEEPVKKVPTGKELMYYILSTPDSDPPIVWEYTLTSCDLLPVMEEIDDFIEAYELNWSVEANFFYDGSGYLDMTGYYKDTSGKTSKVILAWEGD